MDVSGILLEQVSGRWQYCYRPEDTSGSTRFCGTCFKRKPIFDFYRSSKSKCKVCYQAAATAARRLKGPTQHEIERRRAYYAANRDRYLDRYQKNKPIILEQAKERNRWRRKNDPVYLLVKNIQKRMSKVIDGGCPPDWQELIGYDPALLVPHLESLFEPWMSWDNYGPEWHVDHKRPVSSFQLPEQIRECWALSNLQPLSAIDNMRKGATWNGKSRHKKITPGQFPERELTEGTS